MGWIKERASALHEAFGPRRYMLAPLFGAIIGFVDWVVSKLEDIGLGGLIGVPSWAIGVFAALLLSAWWLLEYTVKLRKQLRPSVGIHFEPRDPWIRPTGAKTPSRANPNKWVDTNAIFIRIQVINKKIDTTATNCLIYLTDVKYRGLSGGFESTAFGDTLRLAWSARPIEGWFSPRDIPANARIFADLLSVDEEHNKILVKWEQDLIAHQDIFKETGEYKFEILVTSDNSPPIQSYIIINWPGQWNQISARGPAEE